MKLFVDEDLSPTLCDVCHKAGYDATCSRDRNQLSKLDHDVAQLCLDEERVLVTNNENDFLKLAAEAGLHPGLIVLPLRDRAGQQEHMQVAIEFIETEATALGSITNDFMVNKVIELSENATCTAFEHP